MDRAESKSVSLEMADFLALALLSCWREALAADLAAEGAAISDTVREGEERSCRWSLTAWNRAAWAASTLGILGALGFLTLPRCVTLLVAAAAADIAELWRPAGAHRRLETGEYHGRK